MSLYIYIYIYIYLFIYLWMIELYKEIGLIVDKVALNYKFVGILNLVYEWIKMR